MTRVAHARSFEPRPAARDLRRLAIWWIRDRTIRNGKWEFLAGSGAGHLPTGRSIAVRVRIGGSPIDPFVDNVKVCSAVENVQESQLGFFLQGPSDFVVSEAL